MVALVFISGCSSSFNIVGMWKDVDGSTRIFNEDGTCKNIEPIDIGGPAAVYTMSSKESDGYYSLEVSQSGMNQMNLYVKVINNDHIEIYEQKDGSILYDLERQWGVCCGEDWDNSMRIHGIDSFC